MANQSWSTEERSILNKILENKKAFIKGCALQSPVHQLYTFRATVGWQQEVFIRYHKTNPNYGDQLLAIGRALHEMYIATKELNGTLGRTSVGGLNAQEHVDFFEKLHTKFWERILGKAAWIMENRDGAEMYYNTITENLKELLARGFIYYGDFELEGDGSDWIVREPTTQLTYPKLFSSKTYAQEFLDKWGIPTCYLLKI
jgi:hypothetical protein